MSAPAVYTVKTLAAACGISERQVVRHAKAGTLRLNQAREKIPGVGVIFKAGLAERFVAAMRAKHVDGREAA
ncbi:MAG: hypothetical protein JWM59_2446 [Verrucomicrobiales bacterium]|nr:hypothetical protein [Verrucomicrobiales bacterium]